jgi:hypothetical protein
MPEFTLTILTTLTMEMGPSKGGVRRGSGEAHLVSDFRFVFFGCRCRYWLGGWKRLNPGQLRGKQPVNKGVMAFCLNRGNRTNQSKKPTL